MPAGVFYLGHMYFARDPTKNLARQMPMAVLCSLGQRMQGGARSKKENQKWLRN